MSTSLFVRIEYTLRQVFRRLRGRETPDYWKIRCEFNYYKEVLRLARSYASDAKSVLDVGCKDTPFVNELDWIGSKTAIDLKARCIPGVTCLKGDFMQLRTTNSFDLILCLQVLEHVEAAQTFARKLLSMGKTVIISVPYRWPAGQVSGHCQDPVDEEKLLGWTGHDWIESNIVRDGTRDRLVAVFRGDVGNEVTSSAA